ncbi:MAG: transposase [Fuerstiella sp.]|nr:transposase [Fuerstiella sp.]MCP4852911.1 transposase [Fuerstiella sp.]
MLNVELFDNLLEARVLTERWRRHCNAVLPRRLLNDRHQDRKQFRQQ